MTPADLIERLERATGPDRELDYAISASIFAFLAKNNYRRLPDDAGWYSDTPAITGFERVGRANNYTSSIDDALMLVPEGKDWRVEHMDGTCHAAVFMPGAAKQMPGVRMTTAATPALALCIAALRTRQPAPPPQVSG